MKRSRSRHNAPPDPSLARAGPTDVAAVRAQLLAHLDAASSRLRQRRTIADEDVHEARKSIKRARTVLKLLQPALPAALFESSKADLRDAGRSLSSTRDAKVMADRFAEMRERVGIVAFPVSTIASISPVTGNTRAQRRSNFTDARTRLAAVRSRLSNSPLTVSDGAPLCRGIRSIYRRGRRAMPAKSARADSTKALHEWRKQVKHYLHALEVVLAPGCPSPLRRSIGSARRLADVLGEEHDLALLADALRASAENQDARVAELMHATRLRRRRLRRRALRTGRRLYAETPATLEKQLRRAMP